MDQSVISKNKLHLNLHAEENMFSACEMQSEYEYSTLQIFIRTHWRYLINKFNYEEIYT